MAPAEAPQVIAARTRLLKTLDSLGTIVPGDRWIVGQRLRYLLEAGRPFGADSAAVECAGRTSVPETISWCLALVGYTAQQLGDYSRADAAFTLALEKMPDSERCKWMDLGQLIGRSAAGTYRRVNCQARDSVTAAFWRLVQPLYLSPINDLRTEYLSRVTRVYIEQGTRTPMSDWWGSADRETLIRYGAPLWYTQGDVPPGEFRPQIAGFRREPSFNFFPDAHAFSSPDKLTPDDWEFSNAENALTYAPLWAADFQPIVDNQVALFRRGDSALVVAAFDLGIGLGRAEPRKVGVFAAVIDRGGVLAPFGKTVEQAGANVTSTLFAPWRPFVISLEALDSVTHTASRVRFAPKLPASAGRLSLSDLLLYSPDGPAPASVTEAVPRALHSLRLPGNRQIGVFWETYGVRDEGESLEYALLVTPLDEGLFHRALVKLRVVDPERSVSLQWREVASSVGGIASRGLTVDLSHLKPGRYSIRLVLAPNSDLPIVTERSIEIF